MIRWGLIILCLLGGAAASSAETITLGAENDWVPYANQDGTGMSNEIVRAAYKAVGIAVVFQVGPYNRLLQDVRDGAILGAFNVPRERSNEDLYLFGKTPLFTALSAYYHNRDNPLSATRKEELVNGETVGVVFDYGYGDFFTNNDRIAKVEVRSDLLNLRKLAKGRLDATILYDKTARKLIEDNGLGDKIVKAFDSESADIYVAFSKVFPRARYYADKLDEGLAIIKGNGEYQKILEAY
ncbi:MAG: transporter substrate-binding domain-containing protein [Deltaproteobacteria bacterium]|nr:transporter substrate-binding domain-containing protein [Deltaproteobacteria bacterium]